MGTPKVQDPGPRQSRTTTTVGADAKIPLRTRDVLRIGLVLALLTAFGEILLVLLHRALGYDENLNSSIVWITPVALVLLFSLPVALLLALSFLSPVFLRTSVVVAVCFFLASVSGLLLERRLSMWALLILSLGIAIQAGRMAARYRSRVLRVARVAAPTLVALVLVATSAVEGGRAWVERRAESALPAAVPRAPNVIVIILDTVRALSMSLYGYERATTPQLDRFAARSVTFERAVVPGTWTLPSHASMLTGRWPHELTALFRPVDRRLDFPSLSQVLAGRGYRTGGFIGNWFHIGRGSGLETGFLHYSDLDYSAAQIARGSSLVRWLTTRRSFKRVIGLYETLGRRRAPSVSRAFLRWSGRDSDRPYFALLNYFDAHSPYLPPSPFDTLFGPGVASREPLVIEELNRVADVDPTVVQTERDAYDGGLAYVDHEVGKLIDALDRRGDLDNTIVIITADHGEEIGEHGRFGHAYSMHAEIVHVPLLIHAPGAPAGMRVDAPASMRNIPATVMDLAGIEDASFPGISLAAHWRPEQHATTPPDTMLTEFEDSRSIYTERYHYFTGVRDGREHLYDHRLDPFERNNLATSPEGAAVLPALRALIAAVAPPKRDGGLGAPVPAVNR